MKRPFFAFLFLCLVTAGSTLAAAESKPAPPAYIGSETCSGCHETEATAWRLSDHAHAWMTPGPDTVGFDIKPERIDEQ